MRPSASATRSAALLDLHERPSATCCCISNPLGSTARPVTLARTKLGREVLTWIDGDVPLPPYPAWAMTDRALTDLGRLIRRFHEATATFQSTTDDWSTQWADPAGGSVVCHNDLFPENVVFRDGRVVALIDFAMAAPGRPLWDVAIAAEIGVRWATRSGANRTRSTSTGSRGSECSPVPTG